MGEMFMGRKINSEDYSEKEKLEKTRKIQPFDQLRNANMEGLSIFGKKKSPDPRISAKMAIEELLKQNYDLKKINF